METLKLRKAMKKILLSSALFAMSFSNAQNVTIPDPNFKAFLVSNPWINSNFDAEIQVAEAAAYSDPIDCSYYSISDLTGIEAFTAITSLSCEGNQLTTLDLSQNVSLTELFCRFNQLASIDISQNISLIDLECDNNLLTSLDVSQNIALTSLVCGDNQLTSLDVSNNPALYQISCGANQLTFLDFSLTTVLVYLWCHENQLTSLNLSQNSALTNLYCNDNLLQCLNVKNGNNSNITFTFDATNNPNLSCIEVDDVAWSSSNWTMVDAQTSFSNDCNNDCSPSHAGIEELQTKKEILRIIDFSGKETEYKANTPLIFIYSDGSTERIMKIEE